MIHFRSLIASQAGRQMIAEALRKVRQTRQYGRYLTPRQQLIEAKSMLHFHKLEATYRHRQSGLDKHACTIRHAGLAEHAVALAYARHNDSMVLPPGFTLILED